MNRWLEHRPGRAALALGGGAVVAYTSYRVGAGLFEGEGDQNLLGRFVAWPGGTFPPLAAGAVVLGVLLLPDGRLGGWWRSALARLTWWTALAWALLQLLDDHLLDRPSTPNPVALAVPYPFQDLLEIPLITVMALVFGLSLAGLARRIVHWKART